MQVSSHKTLFFYIYYLLFVFVLFIYTYLSLEEKL